MPKLSVEQSLLLYVISHQYVLLNSDGEIEDDVKKALCGTFNASKMEYKFPDLARDISYLAQMRLITKNMHEKIYDTTAMAKSTPDLILHDENKPAQPVPPLHDNFIKIFWMVFCSFLKMPLTELLKKINMTSSELNIDSDIAAGVLLDLAVKRGLVVRDPNGLVFLTDNGKSMIQTQK
jgi:hypothetical protein